MSISDPPIDSDRHRSSAQSLGEEYVDGGYDSDIVDEQLEASLYAKIFHRDLEWYDQMEGVDGVGGEQSYSSVESRSMNLSVGKYSSNNLSSISSSSSSKIQPKRKKPRIFVEEEIDIQLEENKKESIKIDIASNVIGLKESIERRQRLENRREKNRRRFLRTPQTEWNERFTVGEIQQFLQGFDDEWKLCADDSGWGGFGDRYYGKKRQIQCRNCREYGHIMRQCRTKIKQCCALCAGAHREFTCREFRTCTLCFQSTHSSEACGKYNQMRPIRIDCWRCGQTGHMPQACPDSWRQFHSTISWDGESPLNKHGLLSDAQQRTRVSYCYNCGKSGHLGHECWKPTVFAGRLVCFAPFVTKYEYEPKLRRSFGERKKQNRKFDRRPAQINNHHRFASTPEMTSQDEQPRKSKRKRSDLVESVTRRSGRRVRTTAPMETPTVACIEEEKANGRSNFDKMRRRKERVDCKVTENVVKTPKADRPPTRPRRNSKLRQEVVDISDESMDVEKSNGDVSEGTGKKRKKRSKLPQIDIEADRSESAEQPDRIKPAKSKRTNGAKETKESRSHRIKVSSSASTMNNNAFSWDKDDSNQQRSNAWF